MNPNVIFFVFAILFFFFIIMFLTSYIRTTKAAKADTAIEPQLAPTDHIPPKKQL